MLEMEDAGIERFADSPPIQRIDEIKRGVDRQSVDLRRTPVGVDGIFSGVEQSRIVPFERQQSKAAETVGRGRISRFNRRSRSVAALFDETFG